MPNAKCASPSRLPAPGALGDPAPLGIGTQRFRVLDVLRGTAVAWMVLYHVAFDLYFFGLANVKFGEGFWLYFQRTIATLFILVFGVSLTIRFSRRLARNGDKIFPTFFRRFLLLAGAAVIITLATWVYPGRGFIVFGIIHFLAVSTLLAYPLLRHRFLNLALGLAVIAIGFLFVGVTVDTPFLLWLGLPPPRFYTLDFFPLFPWFGIVLIGVFLGQVFFPNGKPCHPIDFPRHVATNWLTWLGRNAFPIYLIHQPLIVAILMAYVLFVA